MDAVAVDCFVALVQLRVFICELLGIAYLLKCDMTICVCYMASVYVT